MDATVLAAAAAAFGSEARACTPTRGGNFSHVYGFRQAGQDYILRLTPPDEEIDARWMRASLAFIDYLACGGVSVPVPRASLNGELVATIASDDGVYLATCFQRAAGTLGEELPFEVWNEERFAGLGRAVGQFHARARSYQAPAGLERLHWDQGINCYHPAQGGAIPAENGTFPAENGTIPAETIADPLLAQRQAEALAAVQSLPREAGAYGLIHADLHGGNFMLDLASGQITLLDFDDCAYGWYAMDIAMCLHDFCVLTPQEDKDAFAQGFLSNFLRGYLPAHPLERIWIERLPLFLKLLETGIYAQVAEFAASAEPNSWVGRFMKGRRERIAQGIPFVNLDFSLVVQ